MAFYVPCFPSGKPSMRRALKTLRAMRPVGSVDPKRFEEKVKVSA